MGLNGEGLEGGGEMVDELVEGGIVIVVRGENFQVK